MKSIFKELEVPPEILSLIKKEVTESRSLIIDSPNYFESNHLKKINNADITVIPGTIFSNVFLRYFTPTGLPGYDELTSRDDPLLARFPQLSLFLNTFAEEKKSIVGRINLTFLSSKQIFKPHVDDGIFYIFHNRYHLVLQTTGTLMLCGDKQETFYEGDVLYLNNKDIHTGQMEDGSVERIHVIFDILPYRFMDLVGQYLRWFYFATKYPHLHKKTLSGRITTSRKIFHAYRFVLMERIKKIKNTV